MALLSSLLYTFRILATVSVETDKAYRLKDTFSSGTSATGDTGVTSVFESLPEKQRHKVGVIKGESQYESVGAEGKVGSSQGT